MTSANLLNTLFDRYLLDQTHRVWHPRSGRLPFSYTDGDEVEQRIDDIISSAADRSLYSTELGAAITDWPSKYHLSSQRFNLLKPILNQIEGPVLEVGAGCGAITRGLGEKGIEIVALEGSLKRSHIAAARCVDLPKVNVINDNLSSLIAPNNFRTATLVGVLEYARLYYNDASEIDQVDSMLSKIRTLVDASGLLVIAIENQLGLKYLAGYPEDHLGEPMVGIEDRYSKKGVVTFGRKELGDRVIKAGFPHLQWWFPFPDYKLPTSVISERALEADAEVDFANLLSTSTFFDSQTPINKCFSVARAWKTVWRNGLAGELSNSFLLLASARPFDKSDDLASHYGGERRPPFRKSVHFKRIDKRIIVERVADKGAISTSVGPVSLNINSENYYRGWVWHDRLIEILANPDWSLSELVSWAKVWWEAVMATYASEHIGGMLAPSDVMSGDALDSIPRNLMVDGEQRNFFDQEFKAQAPIEVGFVLFRGLLDSFSTLDVCAPPKSDTPIQFAELIINIASGLGFWLNSMDLERFRQFENFFQEAVTGTKDAHNETLLKRKLSIRRIYFNEVAENQRLRSSLEEANYKITENCSSLDGTRSRLDEALLRLAETQSSLDETRSSLDETRSSLDETRSSLDDTRSSLSESRSRIDESDRKMKKILSDLAEKNKRLSEITDSSYWRRTALLRKIFKV